MNSQNNAHEKLVIDMKAVGFFSHALIERQWFEHFELPGFVSQIKRIKVNNTIYIISVNADLDDPIVIINVGEQGVFATAESPQHVLNRVLHVAQATFTNEVSIPKGWRVHSEDGRFSIYAQARGVAKQQRLHFDRIAESALYVYSLTDEILDFEDVPYSTLDINGIREGFCDACLEEVNQKDIQEISSGIVLDNEMAYDNVRGVSLEDWCQSKLTEKQRQFVFAPITGPIRLRGSAGTGKTVSLVVKCARELLNSEKQENGLALKFVKLKGEVRNAHLLAPFFTGSSSTTPMTNNTA